ncbi:2-hydroxyacid dehydrogenase [Candidatus Sodalis sp. SoCistrobi]|uniref:2-hydroxyacid dehydrogenase n=1 Tax=Candidatus Sodalis sp. SoCistrobi TaxID=1922216 RepID=UPI00093DA22B|nr:2-hydroxyacid dehydrogenase [Candidatus Sodalis sp. SoCistrobi]
MTVSLLSHIDIPPAYRPGFAAAGVTLYVAPRTDHTGPLWPDGPLQPVLSAVGDAAEEETFDPGAIEVLLTIGSLGISAQDMAKLPALRLICCLGVGYERVCLAAAAARGISVTHGRGTNDTSVADHALALMLAVMRDIAPLDRAVRRGQWQDVRRLRPQPSGKRVGILGLGTIGRNIAERCARGFAMEVGYHNRRPVADSDYYYCASATALAQWCDILVIATPGGAATRHLVDAAVLEALGAEGFLINIARGSVVETAALTAALQTQAIAGAALDVIEGEPEVPAALLAQDNLLITPHVAARSPQAMAAMYQQMLENLARHLSGQPLLTPVAEKD